VLGSHAPTIAVLFGRSSLVSASCFKPPSTSIHVLGRQRQPRSGLPATFLDGDSDLDLACNFPRRRQRLRSCLLQGCTCATVPQQINSNNMTRGMQPAISTGSPGLHLHHCSSIPDWAGFGSRHLLFSCGCAEFCCRATQSFPWNENLSCFYVFLIDWPPISPDRRI
jgi:hypothetical protein